MDIESSLSVRKQNGNTKTIDTSTISTNCNELSINYKPKIQPSLSSASKFINLNKDDTVNSPVEMIDEQCMNNKINLQIINIHNEKEFPVTPINEETKFIDVTEKNCDVNFKNSNSPKIPDGGWGWMVVLSSLILSIILDGVSFSFGLLYIQFLDYFGESSSKTSWIGSLFLSVPLLSGPIMSTLVDKYGCRKMTMLGGLISCSGFVMASLCNSIDTLLLTFGIIAGLGLGVCYITCVVSVAFWFDKKRTLAVGLAACGSGLGTAIYAPLTRYIIDEYGWRGAVLLLSGTFLNICVCGSVMRDPEWWILEQKKQTNLSSKPSNVSVSKISGEIDSTCLRTDELKELFKSGKTPECILTTLATSIAVTQNIENNNKQIESSRCHSSTINLPTFIKQNEKVPLEAIELLSSNKKLYNIVLENYPHLLTYRSSSDKKLSQLSDEKSFNTTHITMSMKLKKSRLTSENNTDIDIMSDVNSSLLYNKIDDGIVHDHITNKTLLKKQSVGNHNYLNGLKVYRNSLVHRGAMLNISKYKLRASSCPNIYRNSMIYNDYEDKNGCYYEILNVIKDMFNFKMFLEFHFLLMSLGTIVLFIWFIIPYFYVTEFMVKNGYTPKDGAMQISIIGSSNCLGMIFLGWSGDQPWMNVTKCYAACLSLCGLATFLYPLFIHSYNSLIVISALFGISFASCFSLTPAILVELMPLEKFATAYGLTLMCQGIGILIGPPLAGWIYDIMQSWNLPFYLAGIFIFISGVLTAIIPITKNFRIWGSAPLQKDIEKLSQKSTVTINC